jgi:hypothetical protein
LNRREYEKIQNIVIDVVKGYNVSRNSDVDPKSLVLSFGMVYNDYLCLDGTLRERHIELAGYLTGLAQTDESNGMPTDLLVDIADYLEEMIYLKDYDKERSTLFPR